jgi:RHS repeat-associated protein
VPFAFREDGRTYWLQTDSRGAVIRAFDERGAVVWRGLYSVFGEVDERDVEVRQPWRLLGQYADEESGLNYSHARYYSPRIRSYLSRDPQWIHPEATNYSYARNDPWNRVDPFGALAPLLAVGIAGLVGATVGAAVALATGGDPVTGAIEGGIAGAGALMAVVLGASAAVVVAAGAVAAAVGAFVSQVVEDARSNKEVCVPCALKGAGVAALTDVALLGLGRIPGVRNLVRKLTGGRLARSLRYKPSSGVSLSVTPGRTTTVLGTYSADTKHVLKELGNRKSLDYSGKPGGFNLLNAPDSAYVNPKQFWAEHNEPWLRKAIERNDRILMATEPKMGPGSPLFRTNEGTGKVELSGFGREYLFLRRNGYLYDPVTREMVRPQ